MNERRLCVLGRLARRRIRLQAAINRLDQVLARVGQDEREAFSSLMILHWLMRQLRHDAGTDRRCR